MVLTWRRQHDETDRFEHPLPGQPEERRNETGMSLVEVLIALLIIGVVAMGIIPLFSRSVRQNREGGNYTEITNVARSSLEEYLQLDFNAPQLTLAAGSTEKILNEYLDPTTKRWVTFITPAVPPSTSLYQRTIQIQQFASNDLLDNGTLDTPKDGAEPREGIQLKLVRVSVRPLWGRTGSGGGITNMLGKRTPISLEVLKAI